METEGAVDEGDMLKELGEEEEEEKSSGDELPPGGVVVCTEGMATRIHRVIVKSVLPQLHKCLTHKVWRRGGGGGWGGVGEWGGWGEGGWMKRSLRRVGWGRDVRWVDRRGVGIGKEVGWMDAERGWMGRGRGVDGDVLRGVG